MPESFSDKNRPDDQAGHDTDAPVFGLKDFHENQQASRQQTRILWGIFTLLLVLVAGVVFVLPQYVSPPDPEAVAANVAPPRNTPQQEAEQVSPFQEAQIMRQRDAAQSSLQELLDLQQELEEIGVESWAGEDFSRALEAARQGDAAYQEQRFAEARDSYQTGVDILQALQERSSTVFEQSMATGERAIADGEPQLAIESFETAMLIDPASRDADDGLARAQVLGDVLDRLEQGRQRHENGELEAARELYREALAIDGEHAGANQALQQVNADILERNFRNRMSEGYARLQSGNPEQALDSFNAALELRGDSEEARVAIEQARDRINSRRINRHLAAAEEHEQDENWQAAIESYNQALAIDANVVAAQEGRSYARSRNNLDRYLTDILEEPLQLTDTDVYDRTVDIYNQAINMEAPNEKLTEQLREVRAYLEAATVAKPVTFESDGTMQVTLLRESELGSFTSRTLELTPGDYVAVGVRDGCRDVRREFTVPFYEQPPVVSIMCEEQVR